MPELDRNMREAWSARAARALAFLEAAEIAPAFFKPDAIEDARRDYFRAIAEMGRWAK